MGFFMVLKKPNKREKVVSKVVKKAVRNERLRTGKNFEAVKFREFHRFGNTFSTEFVTKK